jgi:asparagine synthetase B (glutamine-hydrolysing)
MCGVLGQALVGRCATAVVEALAHRGPDESRLVTGAYAALGATRLAIRCIQSRLVATNSRDASYNLLQSFETILPWPFMSGLNVTVHPK